MLSKLILFCTFAILMLTVGGAVTPVWAHDDCGPGGKGKHSETHPHCNPDTGSTNDGSLYLVWVDGVCKNWEFFEGEYVCKDRAYGVCSLNGCTPPLVDGICVEWEGDDDVCVNMNAGDCTNLVEDSVCVDAAFGVCADTEVCNWVGYDLGIPPYNGHDPVGKKEAVTVNFQHIDMDLSFFQDYFNDISTDSPDGDACFTGAPRVGGQTVLTIEHDKVKAKDKALVAWYVFGGFGTDGITNFSYRLKLWSEDNPHFSPEWRPTAKDGQFSVEFDHWELSSQNDIACTGSGPLGNPTTISIEKTN